MAHSDKFQSGASFDLHLRTTATDNQHSSYVESVALGVGEYTVEVNNDHIWIDGVEHSNDHLPIQFGDEFKYTINEAPIDTTTTDLSSTRIKKVYRIDLNEDSHVTIQVYHHLLSVSFSGLEADFSDSVGLIGESASGMMMRGDEPKLFREDRASNNKCRMNSSSESTIGRRKRRLRSKKNSEYEAEYEAAKQACSHLKNRHDVELCAADFMAEQWLSRNWNPIG